MIRLIVACVLSMLFLTQCKPEDDLETVVENPDMKEVMISGEIRLPKSRLTMDGSGNFKWGTKDYLYMFNGPTKNLTKLQRAGVSPQTPERLGYMGYGSVDADAKYISRDIYFVGSGVSISKRYIENDINNQSGSLSGIDNYLMSKMSIPVFDKDPYLGYHFPETKMIMYTSVIHIGFPDCECESFYIDYEGCSNYYKAVSDKPYTMPYPEDTTQVIEILKAKETFTYDKVRVNKTARNSYIVLYPQQEPIPNTVMTIYADETVIGTLLFPNGIRSNKLYVSENGGVINLKARCEVVEEDLFVQDE